MYVLREEQDSRPVRVVKREGGQVFYRYSWQIGDAHLNAMEETEFDALYVSVEELRLEEKQ